MARVLIPLPDTDFDVTEVAVPWRMLSERGHTIVFVTERGGRPPTCDPLLLTGVVLGQLGAEEGPRRDYAALERAPEFQRPAAWNDVEAADFDGLILPGGHAPGMRQYLGAEAVHGLIAAMFGLQRPVGAICHGVLAVARATDPFTGASVLADYRTTCLPFYMERTAYFLTAWARGRYYRTYDAYVEEEVRAALADPATQFHRGPTHLFSRGSETDDGPAFVVVDRKYVSARWPGDAYLFARRFAELL